MQNTLKCFLDFSDPYDKGCGEFSLVFMLTFMTFLPTLFNPICTAIYDRFVPF
jgi:hypothetical protein